MVRWCPVEDKAVPWEEVERGYEISRDTYVPITDMDLDRIPLPTVHSVEIADFVELSQVDPIYLDKSYYLGPDEKGAKAYLLLREALENGAGGGGQGRHPRPGGARAWSGRTGRPDARALETLYYADEIRDTADLKIPKNGEVRPPELTMAVSLIDNLTTDRLRSAPYQDNYQEAQQRLIDARAEGRPVPKAPAARGKVVDLMEALRASVDASQRGERRAGKIQARPPAQRTASRRRSTA